MDNSKETAIDYDEDSYIIHEDTLSIEMLHELLGQSILPLPGE